MVAEQPFGKGVNQRALIRMSEDEVTAFLAERRNISMCTANVDGSIHAVAMWYGVIDGQLAVETKAKSQKVKNLQRDPRVTFMAESGEYYEELRGVELVGRAVLSEDPDELWQLGVSVYERYYGPFDEAGRPFVEAMLHKRVAVKLEIERVVSWDHRKLGLPSTRPKGSG